MKYEMVDYNPDTRLYRVKNLRTGALGGWVANEFNLSQEGDCWIAENAIVRDRAAVVDNAYVSGNAIVAGRAFICNDGSVGENAQVFDNAVVRNQASIFGNAKIFGFADIGGITWVQDNAAISGNAQLEGDITVRDDVRIFGNASLKGSVCVRDECLIYGDAYIRGNQKLQYNVVIKEDYHYSVTRTDGYDFMYLPCSDGKMRILAGCRYFTIEEARQHWSDPQYMPERRAKESLNIIDFLYNVDKLFKE